MAKEQILADLKKAIETWDIKLVQEATNAAINEKLPIGEIIGDGLGKGMEVVGVRFDKAEIFLPQVVAASKTMEAAIKILEPLMAAGEGALKGTVVMATVEGRHPRDRKERLLCNASRSRIQCHRPRMRRHRTGLP